MSVSYYIQEDDKEPRQGSNTYDIKKSDLDKQAHLRNTKPLLSLDKNTKRMIWNIHRLLNDPFSL